MDNDPKEPQPSPDGQQQPTWSQQPTTQYGQPQQFSPYDQQQPQWGQQLPPPSGQPPYGVSPSPDFGQSQQPKKRSRHWLWITLAVLGGIVALSCIASTIFVALNLASPGLRSGLRVLLVPAAGTGTPTPAALSATQVLLSERLAAFGLENASVQELTSGSQPTLQVEVPHFGGDERATLETLLTKTDTVEFWNTGPLPVALGSIFDPTQYTQYNPGGLAPFNGGNLDPGQIYVCQDQTGRPEVCFKMKGSAIGDFGTFTAKNVGNYLTVTLDKKVIESAVIQNAITGPGVITGNFTVQDARVIVSELKFPSLPVALHIASMSSF